MTRGRQANTAHVVTGNTAPPSRKPYQQATAIEQKARKLKPEASR